jgi:hypothetical protein
MRDEARPGWDSAYRSLLAAAACLLAAAPAGAEQLYGTLTVQYQQVEQSVRVLDPDSTWRSFRQKREYWLQNYEVNYTERFTERLHLLTQLRYTDVNYLGSDTGERTPYGSLRLMHPEYGFSATYRPITTVSEVAAGALPGAPDSAAELREFTARRREATVFAYVAPRRLPRLDLSWIRRSLEDDVSATKSVGLDRSGRLSYDLGPLSLRGGYGTLARQAPASGAMQTYQKAGDAGASWRALSTTDKSLLFDYQFTGYERTASAGAGDRTYSHAASAAGNLRQSTAANWTLYYGFRRAELRSSTTSYTTDHDGSLLFNYTPRRTVTMAAGGGVRTVRQLQQEDLLWYATALATVQGPVRPGWVGLASLTHTSNWEPAKRSFNVETGRLGSTFTLARDLSANADLQVIANGDTAARAARTVLQPAVGVTARPLPGIYVEYSWRFYRAGPDLWEATSRSSSDRLDLRWTPLPSLELVGSIGHTGDLPANDPRATVRQATVRWTPSRAFQLTGGYVKSTQERAFAVADRLSGRDLFTARLLASPSRSLTFNAGYSLADRGLPTESSQVDGAVTLTFGR